jgi:ABC-type multidrug transport system ATPase subunit
MELCIDGLGKRYKSGEWGLRGLTLTLEPGTVLGLVGPAGAGKTTLLRMLATVMPPTEGTITWKGGDVVKRPQALRQALGYLPQHFGVYAGLSGRAFLADQTMSRYPNDKRWRIGLGQALLNDPQLLLVDEPGLSLNAEERSSFYHLLGAFADHRLAIVATEDVEDVASIATTIALLKGGRLVVPDIGSRAQPCTAPDLLLQSVRDRVWSLSVSRDVLVDIRRQHLISRSERQGNQTLLRIVSAARPYPDAVPVDPTLRDAYTYHMDKHVNENATT